MATSGAMSIPYGEDLLKEVQKAQPDMKEVRWLIEQGDLTLMDSRKRTALMTIVGWGNEELVKFALRHGADVNQKGLGGNTAVHMVAANGGSGVMEIMLAEGGDFAQRNDAGKTPFDFAQGRFTGDIVLRVREKFDMQDPATARLHSFRKHMAAQGLRTEAPTKAPPRAVFKMKR